MDLAQFLQKAGDLPTQAFLPFSLVEGGLPKGGLIELSGATGGGKLEATLRFLAENPALQVAWLEEGETTYPCALPQQGVSLERVLFVNAESMLLDCAHQILRSQIFGALILLPREDLTSIYHSVHRFPHTTTPVPAPRGSETRGCLGTLGEVELRRLQIAAEKSGTTVFLLRETPSTVSTWPFSAQLEASRVSPSFGRLRGELRVKVLKYRFQPQERLRDRGVRSEQALA